MFSQKSETVSEPESSYAWARLWTALLLGTIGCVGMWSVVVALPAVQAEFGVLRADASVPYTLAMLGFGIGNVLFGKLSDRYGIMVPVALSAVCLFFGYVGSGLAATLWQFALLHFLVGLGASATFGPLMADTSQWFTRRRGIAVAIAASGNYMAGTVWPPIFQYFISTAGWRASHIGVGIFCIISIMPLTLILRRPLPSLVGSPAAASAQGALDRLGVSKNGLTVILSVASVACCVAMAMPQVHIVAYCGDLGYGVARGAEMLSLMLGMGIVCRLASGFVADKIGGVATLMIGSVMQGVALFLYLFFDGLTSLYVISALFGLFQGGIVPMYAVIVREYFPPQEAATRVGIVIGMSVVGMALGGWVSGKIFDLTGSYQAAFAHGLMWNLLNVGIAAWLLSKGGKKKRLAFA